MVQSKLTNQTKTSKQSSSRENAKIDTFLIHHQASTSDNGTIEMMVSGSKEVSANYTISNEGRLTSVVPEELRAWTSGSSTDGGKGAAWDRRSITVEIENQTGDPDWKISSKALDKAAELLHDLQSRYKIAHVLGHRDLWEKYEASYATYCPGPETVAEIVKREKLIKDTPAPAPTPKPVVTKPPVAKPPVTKPFKLALPSESVQIRIQKGLGRHGFYVGPPDGEFGTNSLKGIQKALAAVGYKGPINGKIDEKQAGLIQTFAKKFGGYTGKMDKKPGDLTWTCFAKGLEKRP